MKSEYMNFLDWEKKFKPLPALETLGEDYRCVMFMNALFPECMWTEFQDDYDGGIYIKEGWHFVNRCLYWVTSIPAEAGTFYEVVYD